MRKSNEQYWAEQRAADEKVYELFKRVLHEGPRAVEYYAKDDWYRSRFHDHMGHDWRLGDPDDIYAIVGPAYFGDLPWGEEKGVMRATIYPGHLRNGDRLRIWIGPMFDVASRGIWIANQYTRGVHHYFGLTGRLHVPGVVLYCGDNWGGGTERWHIHDTDDEVVAAAIDFIGQRR